MVLCQIIAEAQTKLATVTDPGHIRRRALRADRGRTGLMHARFAIRTTKDAA